MDYVKSNIRKYKAHKLVIKSISLCAPIAIEKFVPVLIDLCVPFTSEIVTITQNTPISNFEWMDAKPP
jgi:hypothetical protein